jgi:hypothetical protein
VRRTESGLQARPLILLDLAIFHRRVCKNCAILDPGFQALTALHDSARTLSELFHKWSVVRLDRLDCITE